MQAIAGPESAFDTPLLPTHSSHRCCHEPAEWGGAKTEFAPGRGETPGTQLPRAPREQSVWQSCP